MKGELCIATRRDGLTSRAVAKGAQFSIALGAAVFALLLTGCNTAPRRFHERLTLFVDTPLGLKSGSSVVEYEIGFQDGWWGGLAGHMLLPGIRGEAVVVDLGQSGSLFALLNNDETRRWSAKRGAIAWVAFPGLESKAKADARGDSTYRLAYFMDALNRLKPKADIDIDSLPLLVRFRDPNDPKTVERVDPNDLAASFGAGVKLVRATEEITDDRLTTGIEKRLPWLDNFIARGAMLDGNTSGAIWVNAPFVNHLGPGYFKSGM